MTPADIIEQAFDRRTGHRELEVCYRIAADLADDQGETLLASGLRWLAERRACPSWLGSRPCNSAVWVGEDGYERWDCYLPPGVFSRLEGGEEVALGWRSYSTEPMFAGAVLAAARATATMLAEGPAELPAGGAAP